MSWQVILRQPRQDSRSREIHEKVAGNLRIDMRETVEATIAAYIRGEDGREPLRQEQRTDPVLAAIMAHNGIRPLRLLRADFLGQGFGVDVLHDFPLGALTRLHDNHMPDIGGATHLPVGLTYTSSRIEQPMITMTRGIGATLPDAAVATLAGRSLGDLVEIPGLERHPDILAVEEGRGFVRLTLERLPSVTCAC